MKVVYLFYLSDRDRWIDMSEIRADKIHNVTGDNDSGIDLSTNDEVKKNNTDKVSRSSSPTIEPLVSEQILYLKVMQTL